MLFCIVIYIILFISAPYIAQFYNDPQMTWMIRVLGLTLIIAGVKSIQTAYVSRNMQFKRFFFATLGGTIGAAFVGLEELRGKKSYGRAFRAGQCFVYARCRSGEAICGKRIRRCRVQTVFPRRKKFLRFSLHVQK